MRLLASPSLFLPSIFVTAYMPPIHFYHIFLSLVATARSPEEALTRIRAAQCAFPQSDGGSIHGFDIIIIEERLLCAPQCSTTTSSSSFDASARSSLLQHSMISTQPAGDDSIQRRCNITSGSGLIRHLIESEHPRTGSTAISEEIRSRHSLFVGVSAHLPQHREKLEKAGADCVWGKPPPEMNCALRNNLLKTLMKKRNKQADLGMFD